MSAETVVPLPRSWVGAELREIVEVNYGKALPERHRDATGSYPVVGSSGVVGKHSCAVAHGPCLVIGRKGAAGSVHYINRSCWPIDTAYFMQPPAEVDITFLRHFLASERLVQLEKSTAVPSLSRDDLYDVKVPLAPLPEQVRIGAKLEELFSDLEAAVAELEAAGRKLTQYRQSLLKAAVEGDLTAEWRASNPPQKTGAELLARILRERRAEPQSAAVDAGALPATWAWANAAQLCGFITKGTTPPKGTGDDEPKTVPFLRVTNLTHTGALDFTAQVFVSQATHQEFLARSRVVPGDVLMNIVGPPLGQVSLVPEAFPEWNVNQAIAIFRPVAGVANLYLRVALLSPVAQRWLKARAKTTAGQTNLTLELCRTLPVPLPPLAEQIEIARLVDEGLEALDTLDAEIQRMLKIAAAQRQNILRAAFSGQLVPQDPNDEPAGRLLERIRTERLGGNHTASPSAKLRRRGKQSPSSVRQRESTIP